MIKNFIITAFILICAYTAATAQAQIQETHKGSLQIVEEPGIHKMHQSYIEAHKNSNGIEGFRVQIYNGRKEACMAQRSRFISSFDQVPVYTLYETPEYRIQVGDFRTQMEAEKFLMEIIDEFSGSFVVKTRIKLPKLIYKEIQSN